MNAAVRTTSLRSQLVTLALAGVLVPLLLGGVILFFLLASRLDATVSVLGDTRRAVVEDLSGPDLAALAHNVAGQLDEYLIGRIFEATAWADSDVVVAAARGAHRRHLDAGLGDLSVEQVEDRFPIAKSLGAYPEADAYLRAQIAASPDFAEAFFTDRKGWNVALTNPTSDFVQSDEDWWLQAWRHKIAVGKVEYDESARRVVARHLHPHRRLGRSDAARCVEERALDQSGAADRGSQRAEPDGSARGRRHR